MSSPRPIALLGLRCAGKTTTGRALAGRTGLPFVDLDDEVLAAARRSVNWPFGAAEEPESAGELLSRAGLAAFRELEAAALRRVLEPGGGLVLATGGGVVERHDNRVWLARTSTCVFLRAPIDVLRRRLAEDRAVRPALLPGRDPEAELSLLAERREPLMAELADLVLESDLHDPAELARRISERLSLEPE